MTTPPILTLAEIAALEKSQSPEQHRYLRREESERLLATARAYWTAQQTKGLVSALRAENTRLRAALELEQADQAECAHAGCAVAYDIVEAARARFQAENARLRAVVDSVTDLVANARGCRPCWKGISCGADCHMNDVVALRATETP